MKWSRIMQYKIKQNSRAISKCICAFWFGWNTFQQTKPSIHECSLSTWHMLFKGKSKKNWALYTTGLEIVVPPLFFWECHKLSSPYQSNYLKQRQIFSNLFSQVLALHICVTTLRQINNFENMVMDSKDIPVFLAFSK